ncbi:MAG: HAMP domain-containing histidine kinase [Eubacteriaceae bacterium]|nr:HAMP domain-containing histidine kinase [Eubacteriaceae bacterium]
MFNRSRKKIILSIMGSLILLFAVTLSVILLASYREIQKKSADFLKDYIERYSLEQESPPAIPDGPGSGPQKPDHPDESRNYQLSTFYSVSFAEDGSVLAVDNGMRGIYSNEDLIGIAEDIRKKGQTSGQRDMLLFQTAQKEGYVLVAFMDNTVTDSSMHTLLRYFLIVGGAAIVGMFIISLFLSKQIIRPLEENDQKQKQFISDASHELKTPVAVIGANAEMLERELGENEWLSNIRYENDRMGELVKQLLDLSRAENTDTPMERVDFSRIVTEEVLVFESLAFDRGKTIHSDIEEDIHLTGRHSQLSQLVSVLLDNAVSHSTGNDIAVFLSRQAHKAVLRVRNEGEEIPPEKLEHLFDRFYQLDEARSSEGRHYGLGLSIAKAVAERHSGSIDVSCHEGRVEFTVLLPAR